MLMSTGGKLNTLWSSCMDFSVKWRHFLLGSATAHAHWHTFMPCVQPRSRAPRPPPALATARCKMYNFSRSEFCQFYRFMALIWTWKVCLMKVYLFQIYQSESRMPRVSILRVLHSFKVFLWSLRVWDRPAHLAYTQLTCHMFIISVAVLYQNQPPRLPPARPRRPRPRPSCKYLFV